MRWLSWPHFYFHHLFETWAAQHGPLQFAPSSVLANAARDTDTEWLGVRFVVGFVVGFGVELEGLSGVWDGLGWA